MKIIGKVAQIIFKNELNSWTVLLLKVENKYITAVGETFDVELEDTLEFDGEYVVNKVYGEQFKFNTYIKVMPKDEETLISYISENIKGVGRKTAERIVKEFGENTIDVIRYRKDELKGLKGLNNEKIENMSDFFNTEWEKWNAVNFLSQFNISVVLANKIYISLGKDTIDIVKENPYSLINFVKNIDFNILDNIGISMGIDKSNYNRIDAGIMYLLSQSTEFGHTCLEKENFIKICIEKLDVERLEIENGIIRLKLNDKINIEERDEIEYIFRRSYFVSEENIAKYISDMSKKEIGKKAFKKEIFPYSNRPYKSDRH